VPYFRSGIMHNFTPLSYYEVVPDRGTTMNERMIKAWQSFTLSV
jgi:hypothetical protein